MEDTSVIGQIIFVGAILFLTKGKWMPYVKSWYNKFKK